MYHVYKGCIDLSYEARGREAHEGKYDKYDTPLVDMIHIEHTQWHITVHRRYMHVNTPGIDRVPVPTRLELIHCLVNLHREQTIELDGTCPCIGGEWFGKWAGLGTELMINIALVLMHAILYIDVLGPTFVMSGGGAWPPWPTCSPAYALHRPVFPASIN